MDVGKDAENDEVRLAQAITFPASVYKVQTLTDNGIRVTLDLPETAIPQMAMLAECRRDGVPLMFSATVDIPQKRRKAGSDRQRPD